LSLVSTAFLPPASDAGQNWQSTPGWRVLEVTLGIMPGGPALSARHILRGFFAFVRKWREAPPIAPYARLHYVLIVSTSSAPLSVAEGLTEFKRFTRHRGRVHLTLCRGDTKTLLSEQAFTADQVLVSDYLPPGDGFDRTAVWDSWTAKALARLCRSGTWIAAPQTAWPTLTLSGFKRSPGGFDLDHLGQGRFEPDWQPRATRRTSQQMPVRSDLLRPSHCAVIGAGLAGASVAAAMAARGWRVTVLDAASAPASGASGVPAGLLCPHTSRDDSPRSRLSRAGVSWTLKTLHRLSQPSQGKITLQVGQDWSPTGVLQRWLNGTPPSSVDVARRAFGWGGYPALWHADAAWVKPQALVQALLSVPGVMFQGGQPAAGLHPMNDRWDVLDKAGNSLIQADVIVLAAAGASVNIAGPTHLKPQQASHGQVSFALHHNAAPAEESGLCACPVNGHGHLITQVPVATGMAWYTGSTYEPLQTLTSACDGAVTEEAHARVAEHAHSANSQRLATLLTGLPQAAKAFADAFNHGTGLQHWRGVRHTPADRMPVCGPLICMDAPRTPLAASIKGSIAWPHLWTSCGMGSRGLTWAVLCAELLAAQMIGEPWPLPRSLAGLMSSRRAAARPQPVV
jgi:tRNA 5-methylaminomethyl-2-thiouridine biosynthesis bifunctional protein